MSGSGRKTHYRKSVTEEFLHGLPLPGAGDAICRCQGSRGTNIFEIELTTGESELAMLPNKFKKLIWLKRGDYLIASTSDDDSMTSGDELKVKYMVKNILTKEQIQHIEKSGLWPSEFKLDPKLSKKEMTKDDIMPDYDSASDYEYEDYEDIKVDKMGNTIIVDPESNDNKN